MELFRTDGHLCDAALTALLRQTALSELERLEIAEHLAFCDQCLQRYTDLLSGTELLSPPHPCGERLWKRIRQRALRLVTSRYATAAAAVVLALTMVWGSDRLPPHLPEMPHVISEHLRTWPEDWNATLNRAVSGFNTLFGKAAPQRPEPTTQGGTY